MAKFVKSNRVNVSNVAPANVTTTQTPTQTPNVLGVMPASLGGAPAGLGQPVGQPTNVTSAPANVTPAPANVGRRRIKPVESVKPVDLEATVTEIVKRILDKEIGEVYNAISRVLSDFAKKEEIECITKVIEAANVKLDKINETAATLNKEVVTQIKDIEGRVKDIEDYLSEDSQLTEAECELADSQLTEAECELADSQLTEAECELADSEVTDEDTLSPDDIDPEKVLQYLRKEPNICVNVIRSVRTALNRKQFAITSIKTDDDAFCECLEALDAMGIDLEPFVK